MDSANQNLKFKKLKGQEQPDGLNRDLQMTDRDFSQASTMSSKTQNFAMNDKQLAHDNQMLTNELIVTNQELNKTKTELK